MRGDGRRPAGRWIVCAVVAGGHLSVLLLLVISGRLDQATKRGDEPIQMVFLNLPERQTPSPPEAHQTRTVRSSKRNMHAPVSTPNAIELPPITPPIDWTQEAKIVARTRWQLLGTDRTCEDTGGANSKLPRCRKPNRPFQWNPKPPQAGVEGLLPYVRLGKHCVIGLGFFGCGIGKLPEANGHLFDDIKDPDRSRSSVPDARK